MGLFGHYPPPIAQNYSVTPCYATPGALHVITYMAYHPMAPISARKTRKSLSLDTAFTQRRFSVSCIHPQLVVVMGLRNATQVPIADWALVSLDQTRPQWLLTPLLVQQIGFESKGWKGINMHATRQPCQDIQASMLLAWGR